GAARRRRGLDRLGVLDLDGLVDRDLEGQRRVAELLPVVGDVVEDDVLVLEDPIGDGVVLLEVEDGVVVELALLLNFLAADLFLLLAHFGRVLGPARVLPEVLREVCLAVLSHFCHVSRSSSLLYRFSLRQPLWLRDRERTTVEVPRNPQAGHRLINYFAF